MDSKQMIVDKNQQIKKMSPPFKILHVSHNGTAQFWLILP